MQRRRLVVGNWKMHGSIEFARNLAAGITARANEFSDHEVALCPPHILLETVADILRDSPVALGAQTLSEHEQGAYTGETSAAMLLEFNCRYVIVGHSERRHLFAESNETIAAKAERAVATGLIPIICVGETLEQRRDDTTEAVIAAQIAAISAAALAQAVIAYEPVWAIGTGESASPAQAQAVHRFIRATIATQNADVAQTLRLLYGGSVKPDNAAELFRMNDVDGGLIGGAALKVDDFSKICSAS